MRVAAVAAGADDVDRPVAGPAQRRRGSAAASIASTIPLSSSTVSPFMRRATTNAADLGRGGLPGQDLVHGRAGLSSLRSRPATSWCRGPRASRRMSASDAIGKQLRPSGGAGG